MRQIEVSRWRNRKSKGQRGSEGEIDRRGGEMEEEREKWRNR